MQTYATWPTAVRASAKSLCEEGFFLTNISDETICTYSGQEENTWLPEDIPLKMNPGIPNSFEIDCLWLFLESEEPMVLRHLNDEQHW